MNNIVAVRTQQGHTLVGPHDELRAWLATAAASGRLTADGLLASGVLPDGRCYARVQLLPVAPQRRLRGGVIAAGGVAMAASIAVTALAVAWVAAHWQMLLGAAVVSLLLVFGLGRVGVCPGLHCPGCRHR